jgi:hypothetical protein
MGRVYGAWEPEWDEVGGCVEAGDVTERKFSFLKKRNKKLLLVTFNTEANP